MANRQGHTSDRPGRQKNRNATWPAALDAGHVAFLDSIHLSPRSVTGVVRPFPLVMQHFYSFVSQVCHFYSSVSQVCHWWCPPLSSVSIHLPMSVTANFRPFPLAMQHFYSFAPQACHWWCPPISAVSIHLSPRSVTAGVRPFPLAM